MRLPFADLADIFSDALGDEDMTGVAAIHDALREVDPSTGDVGGGLAFFRLRYRTAMYAHAHLQTRIGRAQSSRNLNGATDRRFRSGKEDEDHSVTGWNMDEFSRFVSRLIFRRLPHNRIQRLHGGALIVDEKFRIPDDVDEQNMRDFHAEPG